MSALFRKAKQSRIFQDVVDQIQGAILDGHIKAGDKLPSERELCEMLGTSRGTLRESLRVLEQKGLIEIRLGVGGGAIVKDPGGKQITESLAMLIRSQKISLRHLAEFREDVEGTVTGLAAERASDDDIRRVSSAAANPERRIEYPSVMPGGGGMLPAATAELSVGSPQHPWLPSKLVLRMPTKLLMVLLRHSFASYSAATSLWLAE